MHAHENSVVKDRIGAYKREDDQSRYIDFSNGLGYCCAATYEVLHNHQVFLAQLALQHTLRASLGAWRLGLQLIS
jgi:hypothetical protein